MTESFHGDFHAIISSIMLRTVVDRVTLDLILNECWLSIGGHVVVILEPQNLGSGGYLPAADRRRALESPQDMLLMIG